MRKAIATTIALFAGMGGGYALHNLLDNPPLHSDLSYHARMLRFEELTRDWEARTHSPTHERAVDTFMAAYDVCVRGDGNTNALSGKTVRSFLRECGWIQVPDLQDAIDDVRALRADYNHSAVQPPTPNK